MKTAWFPPAADERAISPEMLAALPHARIPNLDDIAAIVASPDTGRPMTFDAAARSFNDGTSEFRCRGILPVLLPSRLVPFFNGHLNVPAEAADDAFLKYFSLASFRHSGDINAASGDVHFQRHLFRMRQFVQCSGGIVLDVGCDDAAIGASLFGAGSTYIGVDPFSDRPSPFRLIGIGEFLPIQSSTCNTVVFNTTLDHIFDWRRAIDEAHRVLKAGGDLVIATLVWTARADLLGDSVHFHHFRDYEIFGALAEFEIQDVARYDYKGNPHRHGMYVRAVKRSA